MNRERLLIVALLVSIAVNLFFVGGIAWRLAFAPDFAGSRPLPPSVGWIIRDLDEQRRQQLTPLIEASAEEIAPLRRAMFMAQRRVNELMAAPDYSSEALAQAFAQLRSTADEYQALSHRQTVNILAELSPAERQAALQFVQRRGPRNGTLRSPPGAPQERR